MILCFGKTRRMPVHYTGFTTQALFQKLIYSDVAVLIDYGKTVVLVKGSLCLLGVTAIGKWNLYESSFEKIHSKSLKFSY